MRMSSQAQTPDPTYDAQPSSPPTIRWPGLHQPSDAAIFASNEIVIPAPIEAVWPWLIRAELWPAWYPYSANIHFISTSGPDLRDRTRFRWSKFGVPITSKVREFEPLTRLAYDIHGIGVRAYQAWLLTPQADGTTHVLTQEVQTGWLARLGKRLMPHRLEDKHQHWLEALSVKAQSGPPAQPKPFLKES
jgi:uncharacterized protein YndB with AHSA1/START domain